MSNKLSSYLAKTEHSFIYTGTDDLYVYIPQRYSVHDLLFIENDVRTIGIFEVKINNESYPLLLPAMLTMCPSDTYRQKIDEVEYWTLVFKRGDIFIKNRTLIKQSFIVPAIFEEYLVNGNIPKFFRYKDLAVLFDEAQKTCGINLGVSHVVLELLYSHLSRDRNNLTKQYRYTDQNELPYYIGLKSVAYATNSATSKIIGSYFADGLNSAIVNPSEKHYTVEDMLRS